MQEDNIQAQDLLPPDLLADIDQRGLQFIRATETDDFVNLADDVSVPSWPEFMMHDEVANSNWAIMIETFGDFQFALLEKKSQRWVAVGNSIPIHWTQPLENLPDAGWDWALLSGVTATQPPNLLCAIAIQILPEMRGQGLSRLMIQIMKALGGKAGFSQLVAPIRPNKKTDYPLLEMETYLGWQKGGEPFDPWIRVHQRLGARFLKVCPDAMLIKGSVKEWESWTGLSFQSSDRYIVPGALCPVKIDIEIDSGVYVEPNVWFVHDIQTKRLK
jgi:GNAT superfamily N-acetyltransferase